MSVSPNVLISIDRTGMAGSPAPLVLAATENHGSSNTVLGVTEYGEPAIQARVQYAPTSAWLHGEEPLGWTYQQSLLAFSVAPVNSDETDGREAVEELRAALSRLSFEITVTVDDAPAETWTCTAGTVEPAGSRTLANLRHNCPSWSVGVPAHPVREVA